MMWVKQVEPKFPITCDLLHYHNIIEIIFKNLFIFWLYIPLLSAGSLFQPLLLNPARLQTDDITFMERGHKQSSSLRTVTQTVSQLDSRRRRRQWERQEENNRSSHYYKTTTLHVHDAFFVHFLAVVARMRSERFIFFFWTQKQSFCIQLQKHWPTFDKLNEMEWEPRSLKQRKFIFKWRFHRRPRRTAYTHQRNLTWSFERKVSISILRFLHRKLLCLLVSLFRQVE